MSKFLKALSVASLSVAAASVFAGGVEAPATMDPSGMFVGVGGGYNSMTANYSNVSFYNGSTTTDFTKFTSTTDGFAPFGQVGYWGHLDQNWMWGVKAFYKYLNASSNYSHGLLGVNADTRVSQEAAGQLMMGMYWNHMLPYIAAGAVWMQTTSNADPIAGVLDSANKGLWGGIFSLGIRKDLNQDWFVDTSYSYAFTGKHTYANTVTGSTASFNRTARISVQSLDVAVNYRFSM